MAAQINSIEFLSWLDLQRAVAEARFHSQSEREAIVVPWNCKNQETTRLWEQITRPENLAVLLELLRQNGSGEPEIWALQALQECRFRFDEIHF